MDLRLRELREEYVLSRVKLDSLEANLPKMLREMVDLYVEQKVLPQFDDLVRQKDFKEALSVKLDYVFFKEHLKQQSENNSMNDKGFKVEERIFILEQKLHNAVGKEELKQQLKLKASNERFIELRENMHKL